MEFNYLLVPRGSLDSKNNVVKVGRTTDPVRRETDYPKGSRMYCVMLVTDSKAVEDKLCDTFRKLFKHRKDYGNEYFEGNIDEMKKYFYMLCEESSRSIKKLYDENNKT
ncbi:GIY-YIG nuclease family protein, partial [Candidatus Woesearchaeota archaeon]|nr:GIY-YIG nuclease family protein [Candidatus Woesearchaeota archaeon]